MENFDISITFKVRAKSEQDAEKILSDFLKYSLITMGQPDISDWEFTEYVPADLKNSCCC